MRLTLAASINRVWTHNLGKLRPSERQQKPPVVVHGLIDVHVGRLDVRTNGIRRPSTTGHTASPNPYELTTALDQHPEGSIQTAENVRECCYLQGRSDPGARRTTPVNPSPQLPSRNPPAARCCTPRPLTCDKQTRRCSHWTEVRMVLTKLDLPSPRGGFPRARPGPPSPPASWSPGVHDRPAAHGRCGQQTRNHFRRK